MNLDYKTLRGSSFAALALISTIAPAHSQDRSGDETYNLDDFVTVANRFELPLDRIGSSVELITKNDLEVTNQPFVLSAMRTTPGFNIRNNGGPGSALGITTRGLNSNTPIVLIDGIEVSNPATGTILNFGNLFGSNISRIEILKGPQSSLYGADAIAGVINIKTLSGNESPGGSIELSGGSFNTYRSNVAYRGAEGAFTFAVNAGHYQSTGFSTQDPILGESDPTWTDNAWADNDGYENTSFSTKIDYQATGVTQLYFVAYYIDNYAEFDPGNPAWVFGEPFADNYSESEQGFAKLGSKTEISENWESQINIGYTNYNNHTNSSLASRSKGRRTKIDWTNQVNLTENWDAVIGAEFEREESIIQNRERDDNSIFMENIFAVTDYFDWTLGFRYDDNEDYGHETTYRSTFSYHIDSIDSRIHGSYGTSFHAPTFYQLFDDFSGNDSLNAEFGEGWDLGIETNLGIQNVTFSSTLFGYDIDDKLNYDYATSKYANEERYQSEGIETAANWYATNELSLKIAHTYASAEYIDGTEAERVPRNTYSFAINWRGLDSKLNLNANAIYTGSQYTLRSSPSKDDGYTVVNLSARYELSDTYTIWARIDNLFDKEYEEIRSYQTPGASYYAGLKLNF